MDTKRVVVERYHPSWPLAFAAIAAELRTILGAAAVAIEHVGSTAVPGLAAKPVIDLDVVIASEEAFPHVRELLEAAGYRHEGDRGIPGREAFRYDDKEHLMKHHLYVCVQGAAELRRHLGFRDHLRTHPEDRDAYGIIKTEAARRFPEDIVKYMEFKADVIAAIMKKAGL